MWCPITVETGKLTHSHSHSHTHTSQAFEETLTSEMGWFQQLIKFVSLSYLFCLASLSPISCKKVSLELYYESLCPYSAAFIVKGLAPIFSNGIIDIVDLRLVPWGNAKLQANNTFTCQHGRYECLLNTIEACAIDAWPKVNEHFPFIYCVENLVYQGKYTQWGTCFETLHLDPEPIADCYDSGRGLELELKYAAETNALQPPHEYVPWVVVDGQPLYEDYENFLSYVCRAYGGTAMPFACSESSVSVIRKKKADFIYPVCYKEVKSKLSSMGAAILSWINQWLY